MDKCKKCGSFAINPNLHGREKGEDLDLCDVCYWKARAIPGRCRDCQYYEIRKAVPDWNVCEEHADYRASDEYCSDFKKKGKK